MRAERSRYDSRHAGAGVVQDAGLAIDLALMATAAGRMELARAAAARAIELAPGELDAHLALALVHRAAGEEDLARAQIGACRAALADRADSCAALEGALAASEPAGRLALGAAIARRAAAPSEEAAPETTTRPVDQDAAFERRMDDIFRSAADACVEVSRWNHILVRLELSDQVGPPHLVDVFAWERGDDDLRECLVAALSRAQLPARPSGSAGRVGTVDFEATGRFRGSRTIRSQPG